MSAILMISNFKIPTMFWGETISTRGIITETTLTPRSLRSNKQIATYQYLVGDSIYSTRGNLRGVKEFKLIGSKMNITYSIQNPEKHKIENFYEDFYPISLSYLWNDSLTTEEIKFENDIAFIETKTIENESISSEILEYVILEEYIMIVPLFNAERKEQKVLRRFDIHVDLYNKETLIERGTGKVFK